MRAVLRFSLEDLEEDPEAMKELVEEFLAPDHNSDLTPTNVEAMLHGMWSESPKRFMQEFGTDLTLEDIVVE